MPHALRPFLLAAALLLLAGGCASSAAGGLPAAEPAPAPRPLAVIRHAWHVGIAFPAARVPPGPWRDWCDDGSGRWLEIGWGDAEYYPASDANSSMALDAAFLPGPAVIHRAFLPAAPAEYFAGAEIVVLGLSEASFLRLLDGLNSSFVRDESGGLSDRGPGLYGEARFFAAKGRFSLFHNCNAWAAEKLQASGCPLPASFITAGALMYAVRAVPDGRCPR